MKLHSVLVHWPDPSSLGLQSNFVKYADGGGFVNEKLAARIVSAGPSLPDHIHIPADGPANGGCC
jgi:hypothetical protein